MNIAYVRVSTVEQNEARQVEELKKHGIEKFFIDKASAKDRNRPELKKMLEFARDRDTIYIHSFDRLARSTKDLLDMMDEMKEKGIELAKKEGKYKGRKKIKLNNAFIDGYERYMKREINKVNLAKELDISRPTLDRLIKEYKER